MLARLWNRWWYGEIGPGPLGLTRIALGLLMLAYLALLWPERGLWLSERGLLPLAQSDLFNERNGHVPRFDMLHAVGTAHGVSVFLALFGVAALLLTVGLWTRASAVAAWLCLMSLHNRNVPIHNSGDILMLVMAAYLAIAPCGAACSLDRLVGVARGREGQAARAIVPWAQRLMQLQVAAVYLCTSLSKLTGAQWRSGMAAYYPLHLPDSARFPVPWVDARHLWLIHALTWGAVGTELAFWTLVWVPRLRLWVLGLGVLLHLGIEYSLNIPLFSALMIASYGVFLTQNDLARAQVWAGHRLRRYRLLVTYHGSQERCRRLAHTLHFFDWAGLVTLEARAREGESASVLTACDARGREYAGVHALRVALTRLPLLWACVPLLSIPGIGAAVVRLAHGPVRVRDSR